MPARSQAQREYLNAPFGHRWVKAHHFDNQGHLPAHTTKGKKQMAQDKRGQLISAFMKKRKPGEVSDVRSSNPKMGRYKSKSGYAIPYSQDTARSPYKRGNRAN